MYIFLMYIIIAGNLSKLYLQMMEILSFPNQFPHMLPQEKSISPYTQFPDLIYIWPDLWVRCLMQIETLGAINEIIFGVLEFIMIIEFLQQELKLTPIGEIYIILFL